MKTAETTTSTEIQLVTKPKIVHKLQEIGANVTKRLEELNIENLVATEDTVKSLKEIRADLNKELTNFEDQRKYVKNEILNPFNEFETVYKIEISDKYKLAIDMIKDKIAVVETQIKDRKKEKIKSYFNELCTAEKIDFITFERLALDINLTVTEKALREKCDEFVGKVIDDLNLIKTTDFEAEIMTEYKSNLNVSQAITTVKNRKEAEMEEAERLHQAEVNRRIAKVKALGMTFDDFSKSYTYSTEVFITDEFLQGSSKGDFEKKFIACDERIKFEKAQSAPVEQTSMQFAAAPVSTPVISAPTVKETPKEDLVKAQFEVTGTMSQLKALGQYMRDNHITYKNIK